MGLCARQFTALWRTNDDHGAELPALSYASGAGPCSAYRRRAVDQMVAEALPRQGLVMLNSSVDEATWRMERALTRFARLPKLAPARGTALNDLPNETRLRRQRAHDVASVLGLLHMDGLDVDAEAFAIAQRYVDGKISRAKMRAAISMHRIVSRSHQFK